MGDRGGFVTAVSPILLSIATVVNRQICLPSVMVEVTHNKGKL